MNTMIDQPVVTTTTVISCPAWCKSLETGYEHAEVTEDGRRTVWHQGPQWGDYVWAQLVSDAETGDAIRAEVYVSDHDDKRLSPGQLRALAADVLAAAQWLEVRA